jgi:hypothetical protein
MKYQLKFTLWMAAAAVIPLAAAGTYLLHGVVAEIRDLERARFKFTGRELVRDLEIKALSLKDSAGDNIEALSDEMKKASAILDLEAVLVDAQGGIKARTKGAVEGGPHDLLALTAKGGLSGRTKLIVESCGFSCENKSAVSPIAGSVYAVGFWLARDAGDSIRRMALELFILLLVSLFSAVALGLHLTGSLKETLTELKEAASQLRQGGVENASNVKTSSETASSAGEFDAVVGELRSLAAVISVRDKEAWARYEKETQRVERIQIRLKMVEALAGMQADAGGKTAQDLVASWFDQEGQAAGEKMEIQGSGTAWPEGSGWMCAAMLSSIDAVMSKGTGPYRLAIQPFGFEVEFKPHDRESLPKTLEPISAVVKAHGGQYGLKGRYDRIIIKALFPPPAGQGGAA